MQNFKILTIEDDPDILELIQFNLERNGFRAIGADNGEKGLKLAQSEAPALVILDIMLPGIDGLSVLKELRSKPETKNLKVIILTAKGEETDIVVGLELGADDYMTKPFSPKELLARIKAVIRRDQASFEPQSEIIQTGPIQIDIGRHEITLHGETIPFTLAEFNILKLLASRPGRVFTRDQILEQVAGNDTYLVDRNVDVHVRSIRKKLGSDKDIITTIRGVGYKCKD